MRRTAIFVGVFLVIAAPIAETTLHLGADRAARAQFARLAENIPGLVAAKITADPWRRELMIKSLALRRAGLTVRIGRITLPFAAPSIFTSDAYAQDAQEGGDVSAAVSGTAGKFAQQGAISAENIEIDAGTVHYAIKRIYISGTSLTKADLNSILDPNSAVSVADRIAKFSASHINIPEIVMQTTLSGQTEKDTYNDVALNDVVQGRVDNATIGSLTRNLVSPTAGTMQSAYGPIKMTGVDLALATRIVSEARMSDSEPRKTLYESVAIEGGKILVEKSHLEIGIGTLSAKDVKGRRLRIPPASAASIFAAQDDDTANRQTAAYLADMLDTFEIGSLELTDLRYTIAKDAPVTGTIGRLYLAQMAMSKIGEAGFENFAVDVAGSNVKIGTLVFRGIDFTMLRDILAETGKIGSSAAIVPGTGFPLVELTVLSGLDVDVADAESDAAADGRRTRFQIAKLDLTSTDPTDGIPTHFVTDVDHLKLDLKNAGRQFENVAALGYDKLDVSSQLEAHFDAAKHELSLDDMSLSGIDMGTLKIAGTFENVTKDLFSDDQAKMEAAALAILIRRIEIRIENAGLLERLIAAEAKKENKSPDQIREKYVTATAVGIPVLLGNGASAKAVGAAVAKFIATPKNLRIVAVAPAGFGASDLTLLKDPSALLDKLSIEAVADE